jgi:hypothetical protein
MVRTSLYRYYAPTTVSHIQRYLANQKAHLPTSCETPNIKGNRELI